MFLVCIFFNMTFYLLLTQIILIHALLYLLSINKTRIEKLNLPKTYPCNLYSGHPCLHAIKFHLNLKIEDIL